MNANVKNFGWIKVNSNLDQIMNLDHKPQGPKHTPIPHDYAVKFFRERLAANNIAVEAERILLSPDTYKLIYVADVKPANEAVNNEFAFSVGFINNNDRTMAFTGIAGTRVFVNSAEFYVSQDAFKTRHVTSVYELLSERVASIMTWFKDYYQSQTGKIEQMKNTKVTDDMLGKLVLKYIRAKYILSSTNIKRIVSNYDNPKYDEFKSRNLWSLRNTTNEVFSKIKSPMFKLDAMNIFDDFTEDYIKTDTSVITTQSTVSLAAE